ncbi:hypothetical protein D3C76_865670 [compost metagenome]
MPGNVGFQMQVILVECLAGDAYPLRDQLDGERFRVVIQEVLADRFYYPSLSICDAHGKFSPNQD